MQYYFFILVFLSLLQTTVCLKGTIKNVYNLSTINTGYNIYYFFNKHYQVKKGFDVLDKKNNSVEYVASDTPLRIKCATEDVMNNSSFPNWIKEWRIDEDEQFDVSQMTFIHANAIIQFTRLTVNDSGYYQCCVHGYAYEDYNCYGTLLNVVAGALGPITKEQPPTGATVTTNTEKITTEAAKIQKESNSAETKKEAAPTDADVPTTAKTETAKESKREEPSAYNINISYGQQLNAKTGEAYFIKLFPQAQEMNCSIDGTSSTNIFFNNKNFPAELNSDILIPNYNGSIHNGMYECNTTITKGNETETTSAYFTVVSSPDSNMHSTKLDPVIASKYRNTADSSLARITLVLLCMFVTIILT